MRYKDVTEHFGSVQAAAEALGVRRQTVYAWKYRKRIPELTQAMIQLRTGGRLTAELRERRRK